MTIIRKSTGTTASERYLAGLADKTFLNLWSYPNLFIDKRTGRNGQGKELCDLLVICGDHVLIFSDKSIDWPTSTELGVAWSRWYRRAVEKSVHQIRGAQRWLAEFPHRIFLDAACAQPLPLEIPSASKRKVHGIVVAGGAREACIEHFGGGLGSLLVMPELRGNDHLTADKLTPFAIGDVDPNGAFVHVFDEVALDVVLGELDTINDLADYLERKERLVRSGHLLRADGEEDLVAYYMTHMSKEAEHDFVKPDGSAWLPSEKFVVIPGTYQRMLDHPQYVAKKLADQNSYVWDRLIEAFTTHMLAGTTLVPDGSEFRLSEHEQSVRYMALVPRFLRRKLGEAVLDALEKGRVADRFTRALLPGPNERDPETGFFFMTLKVPKVQLENGYEQYRAVRRNMLETYALVLLRKFPHLKRIVGITTEPPRNSNESVGASEDLILAEAPEWTDDLTEEVQRRQEVYDVARPERVREYRVGGKEFPDIESTASPPSGGPPMNRKQRRMMSSRARRKPK